MRYVYVPESEAGEAEYRSRVLPRDLPPPPITTSRQPLPREVPAPVLALALHGEAQGWLHVVQYSHGYAAKYRGAWQPEELFAVRFQIGGFGAFAVYRSIAGRETWTWRDVWMWGVTLLPFGQGGVTDLKEWLAAKGRQPDLWYADVSKRVAEQEQRRKETARNRPKTTREVG